MYCILYDFMIYMLISWMCNILYICVVSYRCKLCFQLMTFTLHYNASLRPVVVKVRMNTHPWSPTQALNMTTRGQHINTHSCLLFVRSFSVSASDWSTLWWNEGPSLWRTDSQRVYAGGCAETAFPSMQQWGHRAQFIT